METGSSVKLHCRHGLTEYQNITTGVLWEFLLPTLGSDTPRHYIDCVRLVATRKLEIVKRETISKGDIVDKYTIVSHPWTEALTDLVNETKVLCRNDDSSDSGGGSYFQRISARLTEGGEHPRSSDGVGTMYSVLGSALHVGRFHLSGPVQCRKHGL